MACRPIAPLPTWHWTSNRIRDVRAGLLRFAGDRHALTFPLRERGSSALRFLYLASSRSMARPDPVDIGEAARRVGVSTAALRLYERKGLLPKTSRSASGYRQYSAEDLRRARLVWRARRAGLSLQQIAQVLGHADSAAALRRLLSAHVEHLDQEYRRMGRLRRHLCRWLAR